MSLQINTFGGATDFVKEKNIFFVKIFEQNTFKYKMRQVLNY